MTYAILDADCLELMRDEFPADSVEAIVTDPPYGLSFMGKDWDHGVPGVPFWVEALRVLKPGGHLLAFGGTRTYHRLACAIEDAGFEIRDCLQWLYGSGFPKSLNVSKAIEKRGVSPEWREVMELSARNMGEVNRFPRGWGTALKPGHEPIVLARKPFKGTVANNVLEHGTGALNIDGCRVGVGETSGKLGIVQPHTKGRWPANVILDEQAGVMLGEPARFFYCPKASKKERGEGNIHPTVKPIALMRYLCRLITPPGGTVLDPFCGSGTTGVAAVQEGFDFVGIDKNPEYVAIADARLASVDSVAE